MSQTSVRDAQLSPLRRRLLQLAYLIIVVGLGVILWPTLLTPGQDWSLMSGVVKSMLASMSLLAIIGLFRPVEMLPLLMFEVGWKLIWLLRMALPMWQEEPLDAAASQTLFECLFVFPFMLLIPWDHVWRRFFVAGPQAVQNMPSNPPAFEKGEV